MKIGSRSGGGMPADAKTGDADKRSRREDILKRASLLKVPPAAMKAAALIAAVAIVISMVRWLPSASGAEFNMGSPAEEQSLSSSGDLLGDPGASGSQGTAAGRGSTVFVHVVGAVNSPGVYSLSEGSRVNDAVQIAGGFSEEACTSSVNLAREVCDGEQVAIPTWEEAQSAGGPATAMSGASTASQAGGSSAGALVNINTATVAELDELPGVGPSTAQAIVDYRTQNGRFSKIEEIKEVSGIGEGKFSKISDSICV